MIRIVQIQVKRHDPCLWEVTYAEETEAQKGDEGSVTDAEGKASGVLKVAQALLMLDTVAAEAKLKKGLLLSQADFEVLCQENSRALCRYRAYQLTARSRNTCFQMGLKLRQKGFAEPEIGEAVAHLVAEGYLDDRAYAVQYVAANGQAKSRQMLLGQLQAKGIAKDVALEALEAFYQENDRDAADLEQEAALRYLSRKKIPHWTGDRQQDWKTKEKLLAGLVRQGFGLQVARQALEAWLESGEKESI